MVAAAREDDSPPLEALEIATIADRLGYAEVWIGEGPTWDAFTLTAAIGMRTRKIALTAGPAPVHVRDPFSIARGASAAAALAGRPVGVALGTSSTRVVEGIHGRSRTHPPATLAGSAAAVKDLLGPLAVAVEHADRMLADLVSPDQVRILCARRDAAVARAGRRAPPLAAWIPAAVDPAPSGYDQIMRSITGYLTVPGYSDMFTGAGFGDAVQAAHDGARTEDLLRTLPPEATEVVGLVDDTGTIRERLDAYTAAGLDEIAICPATAGDPSGRRTLTALSELR